MSLLWQTRQSQLYGMRPGPSPRARLRICCDMPMQPSTGLSWQPKGGVSSLDAARAKCEA